MAEKRKPGVLVGLKIKRVSLVDRGANQEADICLLKSDTEDASDYKDALAKAQKALRSDESIDAIYTLARCALMEEAPADAEGEKPYVYIQGLFKKNIVYQIEDKSYRREYQITGGAMTFTSNPVEVVMTWVDKKNEDPKLTEAEKALLQIQQRANKLNIDLTRISHP